eukprot:6343893-Prymnesium_polylepis.1
MSDKGGELRFGFGDTGASMSALDRFERALHEAIKAHTEASATSMAHCNEALERGLNAASTELASVAKTRDSKCKRAGRELRAALAEVNELSGRHQNVAARERMAAVQAADSTNDPSTLSKDAALRQRDSA